MLRKKNLSNFFPTFSSPHLSSLCRVIFSAGVHATTGKRESAHFRASTTSAREQLSANTRESGRKKEVSNKGCCGTRNQP
jgi:hypothetical protein